MRAAGQHLFSDMAWPFWERIRGLPGARTLRGALRKTTPAAVTGLMTVVPPVPPLKFPPEGLLRRYAGKTEFSHAKAAERLGYSARVDRTEAARVTAEWARWARLV